MPYKEIKRFERQYQESRQRKETIQRFNIKTQRSTVRNHKKNSLIPKT